MSFSGAVILACLVKFVIQLELGRQCLLRKSSTVQILDQVPGARWRGTSWIAWLCVVGYFSVTVAVIGILGSVAGLNGHGFSLCIRTSVGGSAVPRHVGFAVARGYTATWRKWSPCWWRPSAWSSSARCSPCKGRATQSAASKSPRASALPCQPKARLWRWRVMGSVGATAVELFMYPYWIVEKGYPDFVGPKDDSPEWQGAVPGLDAGLDYGCGRVYGIALVVTCAYYLLGASVLNQLQVLPEGMKVVEQVSLIFTESIGGWAYYIFMFGGFLHALFHAAGLRRFFGADRC